MSGLSYSLRGPPNLDYTELAKYFAVRTLTGHLGLAPLEFTPLAEDSQVKQDPSRPPLQIARQALSGSPSPNPDHRIVTACDPWPLLLLFSCRVKKLADGSVEQVGLVDERHVSALGKNYQLGPGDRLIHFFRERGCAFVMVADCNEAWHFDRRETLAIFH